MKTRQQSTGKALLLATAFLASGMMLTACGGSGSGGGGDLAASTSGISRGEIEGFGSIIVNGVRFDDSGAEVEFETGESARDLAEGMIVEVEGTFDDSASTGTANVVRVSDTVEGPATTVASTSPRVKTLSILGQTVIIEDGVTNFDDTPALTFGTNFDGLTLEVSGQHMADGSIMATFVEQQDPGGLLEVKGLVSNLDTTAETFMINGLTVNYSGVGADSTEDVAQLANGIPVEVKGTAFDSATTTLTATIVEVDDLGDDIAKVELEGFIASLNTAASTFMLNGQMVNYSGAAFLGGIEDDLANGIKVEAEGPIQNGVLNAVKVKFKESIRIEGNAINVDSLNNTFQIEGVTNLIVTEDDTLTEGSVADGTDLKVRARASGSALLATRIDDQAGDNASDRLIVQAPVTVSGDLVTLQLNVTTLTIDTTTITENSFDDSPGSDSNFQIEDQNVTRAQFLAALNDGDIVKARADLTTGSLVWEQIEIELEDD